MNYQELAEHRSKSIDKLMAQVKTLQHENANLKKLLAASGEPDIQSLTPDHMQEPKPTIAELWSEIAHHEKKIEKIKHYIAVEWPEELRRAAKTMRDLYGDKK